ncbi:MAG: ABC transporter ATP-binding protein [Alphaproteobacteria bacterium]|nr:ABC transporter ATP-binding protein [Alphaproteobacteria bacterium]
MSHVRLDALSKVYGSNAPAVDDLTLTVERGEFLALLGPSGCGKTTTLRMIAGLVPPTGGTITVGGADVTSLPPYRRNMGLVFQNYALFPHMSVADNIAFGLEMRNLPRSEQTSRIAEALAMVRLEGYEKRRPRELSGGQQQRVALARALVIRPDVLLLDECLSNLDAKLREQMRIEIREIQRRLGITAIFVTHDQVEALTMCDRVALMDRGRLAQVGTPEDVYERPANRFVANFVGRINVMRGEANGASLAVAGAPVAVANAPRTQGTVDVMVRPHRMTIRPEDVAAAAGENRVSGTIGRIVYIGDVIQVAVDTPAGPLVAERTTTGPDWHTLAVGQRVAVAWSAADTLVFPPEAR